MGTSPSEPLGERPEDGADPHRDPQILRYLLHEELLSPSEAAEAISEAFDYEVTASKVRKAKYDFDIRDPTTDGPFADILEGGNETEPAQPPSFLIDRSEDTPVHPCETSLYELPEEGGGTEERKSLTTPRNAPFADYRSDATTPDTTDSPSQSGTPLLKGPQPHTPSEYRVGKSNREEMLVAPPEAVASDDYPDAYKVCGCGECSKRHFLDGDDGGAIDCPEPFPCTIGGARRIYQHTEGTAWAEGMDGNAVDRARGKYARLMKADSAILREDGDRTHVFVQSTNDDVTTVLISCRVSPTDDEDRLVSPYVLVRDVKDAWREARDELPYDDRDMLAYYWSLAGTDDWASPHVHCYVWLHDAEDRVTPSDFDAVVGRFVQSSTFAPRDAHFADVGGDTDTADDDDTVLADTLKDGTVRVECDPLLVDRERLEERLTESDTPPERLKDGPDSQTRGAVYVGTQLPHFALRGRETDADAEFAAFSRIASGSGRLSFGGLDFYEYADELDGLTEARKLRAD